MLAKSTFIGQYGKSTSGSRTGATIQFWLNMPPELLEDDARYKEFLSGQLEKYGRVVENTSKAKPTRASG